MMIKLVKPTFEIAIVGENSKAILHDFQKQYLPDCIFSGDTKPSNLPLLEQRYRSDQTLIYVCANRTCQSPVRTVAEAIEQISNLKHS